MSHVPAERCLDIIELLAEGAGNMALGDIAERLELPKSGAHRLLATLVELGWAEKDPDTSYYRLTMRLAILGLRFYVASGIPDICQPLLDRLAGQCREFARLAVVDGDSLTWIAHAQGATGGLLYQPFLTTSSVPLYATATGKAWLSTLPVEQAIQYVLKAGFENADQYGPEVVRSLDAFLRELKTTTGRGYGLAVNEAEPGMTAIAAPIRPASGGPAVGTVSIAGPSVRMNEARIAQLSPLVLQYAAEMATLWPLRSRAGQAMMTASVVAKAA
ncbi:MAG: IclR family transcriptional regulator [Comamonadaceae bacterium]|nr:MAG: IclR family transcriptional regulator [Comamonadaceae bacterium]